jgi:ABC-type Na+ efflux pump permease subunit
MKKFLLAILGPILVSGATLFGIEIGSLLPYTLMGITIRSLLIGLLVICGVFFIPKLSTWLANLESALKTSSHLESHHQANPHVIKMWKYSLVFILLFFLALFIFRSVRPHNSFSIQTLLNDTAVFTLIIIAPSLFTLLDYSNRHPEGKLAKVFNSFFTFLNKAAVKDSKDKK